MLNFNWLIDLPLPIANIVILLAFIVPLVFALILPRAYIYLGAKDQKQWRNLKWWVVALVLIQVSVYIIF
jgi:hypothetical protein